MISSATGHGNHLLPTGDGSEVAVPVFIQLPDRVATGARAGDPLHASPCNFQSGEWFMAYWKHLDSETFGRSTRRHRGWFPTRWNNNKWQAQIGAHRCYPVSEPKVILPCRVNIPRAPVSAREFNAAVSAIPRSPDGIPLMFIPNHAAENTKESLSVNK